jgi:hypothetical protein
MLDFGLCKPLVGSFLIDNFPHKRYDKYKIEENTGGTN